MSATNTLNVELREADGSVDIELPREVALALIEEKVASVAPTSEANIWNVSNVQKVGAFHVAGSEVHIAPKLPIGRLLHMLAYSKDPMRGWREDEVQLDIDDDVVEAMAQLYAVVVSRAVERGLLQGYRHVRESANTVRGRIDFAEQLKRRVGMPAPIEVAYDEFGVDIRENQILASALDRLLRLPRLATTTRRRLRRVRGIFVDVSRVRQGVRVERSIPDRRFARYRGALEIAYLILDATSVEHRQGSQTATGFLLNMATIFEDFLGVVVTDSLQSRQGQVDLQARSHLDDARRLKIRPDFVWRSGDGVLAVMDAKYKAEKPAGYPNADVYQMLAYCTRYGLSDGHLIYAAGEVEPTAHEIVGAGIRIHCHAVDLGGTITEMHDSVRVVADRVAGVAQSRSRSWLATTR